jgi:hypothetical protein
MSSSHCRRRRGLTDARSTWLAGPEIVAPKSAATSAAYGGSRWQSTKKLARFRPTICRSHGDHRLSSSTICFSSLPPHARTALEMLIEREAIDLGWSSPCRQPRGRGGLQGRGGRCPPLPGCRGRSRRPTLAPHRRTAAVRGHRRHRPGHCGARCRDAATRGSLPGCRATADAPAGACVRVLWVRRVLAYMWPALSPKILFC